MAKTFWDGLAVYSPSSFAQTDQAQLHALIRAHSFGLLISVCDGDPVVTHLPLSLDTGPPPRGRLLGHVARANPHWRHFDANTAVLAVFHGPHAYVSPRWYGQAGVPTWNYTAVHVSGRPRVVEDRDQLRAMLARLTEEHELHAPQGWRMGQAADLVERMLDGIVGFEMPIDHIQGKYKLSQNRSQADRDSVAAHLAAGTDDDSVGTASLMYALGLASR